MADAFDPDKWLAEKDAEKSAPGAFDPDAYLAESGGYEPNSPLAKALAATPGDVVSVDTPTGAAQFDRQGRRVLTSDEVSQGLDAGDARLGEAAWKGALSTLSGAGAFLTDELAGVKEAAKSGMRTLTPGNGFTEDVVTAYRRGKGSAQTEMDQATRDVSPTVNVMGANVPVLPIVGAMLTSGPVAASWLPRVAAATFGATLHGAGSSRADLTKGETGQFAEDVGTSAAFGLGGGLAGEAVTAIPRAIGNSQALTKKIAEAYRRGEAVAAKPIDKAAAAFDESVASAAGKARSETQKASRLLENTQRGAGGLSPAGSGPAAVDPALQGRAALALSSPEAKALAEGVLENTLDELPQQLGEVAKSKAARDALQAAKPAMQGAYAAERGSRVADYFDDPLATAMAPFVRSQLPRAAFAAGVGGGLYGLGSLTNSDTLRTAGAAAGAGSIMGAPGFFKAAKNLANNPAGQFFIGNAVKGAAQTASTAGAQAGATAGRAAADMSDEDKKSVAAFIDGG